MTILHHADGYQYHYNRVAKANEGAAPLQERFCETMKSPKEALAEIMSLWSASDNQISKYLSKDFDKSYLAYQQLGKSSIFSEPFVTGNKAKFLVYASAAAASPYLAVLVKEDEQWLLEILSFQCLSCFGTGTDGAEICNVCGGTGWGIIGDLEFCRCVDKEQFSND